MDANKDMFVQNLIKNALLNEAKDKPIHRFMQFDVFQHVDGGDDVITPDKDGDSLFGGGSPHWELNRTNELRVMVPENRTPEEIVRGLRKVIDWIEENPSMLDFDKEI